MVHFACHGISHPEDPARSALVLQETDTKSSKAIPDFLTVQQVLKTSQLVQLVFLSACSTAENKISIRLVDEVIHIASAFFIAGFSHVVGSMWPSSDHTCVQVADHFYANLAESKSKELGEECAYALHNAVLEVRSRHLKQPLLWAQYIHIGP